MYLSLTYCCMCLSPALPGLTTSLAHTAKTDIKIRITGTPHLGPGAAPPIIGDVMANLLVQHIMAVGSTCTGRNAGDVVP